MGLYRIFMAVVAPVLVLWAIGQMLTRREGLSDFRERVGLAPRPARRHASLWVHAASNGELASCEEVVRSLLQEWPNLHLLITTNSVTGRTLAKSWDLPQVTAHLAPFDWRWAAKRLIAAHDVKGHVFVEAEVWPNRMSAHFHRDLPVVILGARLSRKTARSWRRFIHLARPLLRGVTWIVPQDAKTMRRMDRLGVDPTRMGQICDLKALYSTRGKPAVDTALIAVFPPDRTWLAASTHPGEDEIILSAHAAARAYWPDLELILAPRHPKRAKDIVTLARARGFDVAQRSRGDRPRTGALYLADTLGEMPRFYANAEICLVAGSLVDKGGHTPYEPMAFDCALLHGPYLSNFQATYRRLDICGGALQVNDAEALAFALGELRDPERRSALRMQAQNALGDTASPDQLTKSLIKLIKPAF